VTLGDKFPKAIVAESIERQFQVGTVIKLEGKMDDGKVHLKRYVIAAITEGAFVLVINSEVSKFVQSRPLLLQCHVSMPAASPLSVSAIGWVPKPPPDIRNTAALRRNAYSNP